MADCRSWDQGSVSRADHRDSKSRTHGDMAQSPMRVCRQSVAESPSSLSSVEHVSLEYYRKNILCLCCHMFILSVSGLDFCFCI